MQDLNSFIMLFIDLEQKGWPCRMCKSVRQKLGHTNKLVHGMVNVPFFLSNRTSEYVLPRPQLKLPYASCCCFSVQLHGKQFALLFLPNLISQRGRLCVTTYYVLHNGVKKLEPVCCKKRQKIVPAYPSSCHWFGGYGTSEGPEGFQTDFK